MILYHYIFRRLVLRFIGTYLRLIQYKLYIHNIILCIDVMIRNGPCTGHSESAREKEWKHFEGSVSLCPQIGRRYYHRVYHYGTNWQTVHNELYLDNN